MDSTSVGVSGAESFPDCGEKVEELHSSKTSLEMPYRVGRLYSFLIESEEPLIRNSSCSLLRL